MNKKLLTLTAIFLLSVSANIFAQKTEVLAVSKQVVTALKNKDMKTLATLAHPAKGVRFSPYSYINVGKEDLIFKQKELANLFASPRVYDWGAYDAGEDEIKMTFVNYYKKFIYDVDFANMKRVGYNEIIGRGNSTVNIAESYPKAKFVEYYFPGTKKYDNMNWRSLRLIFEKSGKRWFLVGISHAEWTT